MQEAILALVTAVLGVVGLLVKQYATTKLTPQKLGSILNVARTVVQAAERVGEAVPGMAGADKYAYAEQSLLAFAKRLGLKLSPEEANAFIHAALREFEQVRDGIENYAAIGRQVVEQMSDEGPAPTGAAA